MFSSKRLVRKQPPRVLGVPVPDGPHIAGDIEPHWLCVPGNQQTPLRRARPEHANVLLHLQRRSPEPSTPDDGSGHRRQPHLQPQRPTHHRRRPQRLRQRLLRQRALPAGPDDGREAAQTQGLRSSRARDSHHRQAPHSAPAHQAVGDAAERWRGLQQDQPTQHFRLPLRHDTNRPSALHLHASL